ncbi:hypothetical protein BAR24066_01557 [Burkholderia arboris]|uniref:Uncharacterized protein n=1 Tax=Burkholderia arboris TaxID=488730 RepID=A0A9Q9SFF8_9BURK|nr:hypothetical protein [Burkholderia arboris]VWB35690.1 hypothetical protein BAR24066_01557 [Burkholderia arboris]
MAHVCNMGGTVWPNGLPPGWCMQDPINDVSLWYDKRYFKLKNASDRAMRATVKRTLTSGQVQSVDLDVNNHDATDLVVWLAGTDTGSIELVTAVKSPESDTLKALDHLAVEQETGVDNIPLSYVRNHWGVPVYISIDIYRDNMPQPDSWVRHVLDPRARLLIYADFSVPTFKWRAGVLERTDFYQPWPPQPAIKVSPATP